VNQELSQDVKEAIEYILFNFELAEVDIIQEHLLKHLNWYIETTNQQWEH